MKRVILSLIFGFFIIICATGQVPPPPPPDGPPNTIDEETPPPPMEREKARFFLAYKMKDRLNLTESQTLKILEILKENDDFRISHREKMQNLRNKAYNVLQNPKSKDEDFEKILMELKKLKDEGDEKMEEFERKIYSVLTPKQKLEWFLLKREFFKTFQGEGPKGRGHRGHQF